MPGDRSEADADAEADIDAQVGARVYRALAEQRAVGVAVGVALGDHGGLAGREGVQFVLAAIELTLAGRLDRDRVAPGVTCRAQRDVALGALAEVEAEADVAVDVGARRGPRGGRGGENMPFAQSQCVVRSTRSRSSEHHIPCIVRTSGPETATLLISSTLLDNSTSCAVLPTDPRQPPGWRVDENTHPRDRLVGLDGPPCWNCRFAHKGQKPRRCGAATVGQDHGASTLNRKVPMNGLNWLHTSTPDSR